MQSQPGAVVFPETSSKRKEIAENFTAMLKHHMKTCKAAWIPASLPAYPVLGSCQSLRRRFAHPPAAAPGLSPSL